MESNAKYTDNWPNASKLMASLRHLDYENVTAICDIIDNSIDAGSTQIWLNLISQNEKSIEVIEIVDNGVGMDSEILDEALKLGSNTEKNPEFDLGLYGMGLITASISIGKRLEVYTRTDGEDCLISSQDLDEISSENRFIKTLAMASSDEKDYFLQRLRGLQAKFPKIEKGEKSQSIREYGTIVKIKKIDHLTWATKKGFAENLIASIGQTFRKFIKSGKTSIYVDGIEVEPRDPIYDFDPTILNEEELKEDGGTIRLVIAELRDYGPEINRSKGINWQNQGFYLIRNNREIAAGESLGVFTKHNDFNTLRIEFNYPATLDSILKSTFSKQRLFLPQSIKDRVQRACTPFIKQVRVNAKRRQKKVSGKEDFTEIEKYITQKSHLLTSPPAEIEERRPPTSKTDRVAETERQGGPRLNITKRKRVSMDQLRASFRHKPSGEKAPIYSAEMEKNTVVIYWNDDHPFYNDFIAPSADDPKILNPICFLIYCMASAELKSAVESDSLVIIDNIKWDMSRNLATLLN